MKRVLNHVKYKACKWPKFTTLTRTDGLFPGNFKVRGHANGPPLAPVFRQHGLFPVFGVDGGDCGTRLEKKTSTHQLALFRTKFLTEIKTFLANYKPYGQGRGRRQGGQLPPTPTFGLTGMDMPVRPLKFGNH